MTSGIQDRKGDRNLGNWANSSSPATRFARLRLLPGTGVRPAGAILPAGPPSCQRHLPEGCPAAPEGAVPASMADGRSARRGLSQPGDSCPGIPGTPGHETG